MPGRTPRMMPLTDEELDPEQEAMIAPLRARGQDYAISRVWLHHPRSLRAFNGLARHVFSPESSTLPLREREVLVLRTAWRCRSGYEWARHLEIGREAGLSDEEMEALKRDVEGGDWSDRDATLIAAADALMADFFMPDDIWVKLAAQFDEQQCIDVMLTVGMYALMGMFLNSARVPLDPGLPVDPDF